MKTISTIALVALLSSTQAVNLTRKNTHKDAYDLDPNTVSPYDAAEQHAYLPKYDEDFGNESNPKNFEGAQIGTLMAHIKNKKDMYDNDSNTVS